MLQNGPWGVLSAAVLKMKNELWSFSLNVQIPELEGSFFSLQKSQHKDRISITTKSSSLHDSWAAPSAEEGHMMWLKASQKNR